MGRISIFIPHPVLSAGPSGGSCLRRRKETGEKAPRTKERMQEPARKELYWHDPTGCSRHPHRPGCEPREGRPEIPAEPLGGEQRGVPGTPSCCQRSQGHHSRGEGLCAELQREAGPPAPSPRAPQIGDSSALRDGGLSPPGGPVLPQCQAPAGSTGMGRDEGMRGGLRLQREGKGGEGWEKGKEVKGPSGEQGRALVMATRVEGEKKPK